MRYKRGARRFGRLAAGALGLVFAGLGLSLAQRAAAAAVDPVAAAERRALLAELHLDVQGAFDGYLAALDAAQATGDWVHAETYVYRLAPRIGVRANAPRLLAALSKLGSDERAPATLRALCRWGTARGRLALGDVEAAERSLSGLGLLRWFAVSGPFDNERGGGMSARYGPERTRGAVDLAARFSGKGGACGWRVLEGPCPFGVLDLDALFRPHDEVLAYALAYVRNDGPGRTAALRIGSDEGLAVWWNDQEVLRRDVYRERSFDQDAVGVWLRAGWNKVFFKVGERKGAWQLLARITAPDGRPVSVHVATADEIAHGVPLSEAKPAGGMRIAAQTGAIERLRARVRTAARGSGPAAADSWRDLWHLGVLEHERRAHGEGVHPAREAFRRAVARAPKGLRAALRLDLAQTLGRRGELSVSREQNARRLELEAALRDDPKAAAAALRLAAYALFDMDDPLRAAQLLARADAVRPGSLRLEVVRLAIWERRGLDPRVRARLEALALGAKGAGRASILLKAAAAFPRRRRAWLEEALAEVPGHAQIRRKLVAALEAEGADPEAERRLREAVQLSGWAEGPRRELAAFLAARERFQEAETVLREALRICPQSPDALSDLARLLHRRGLDDRAAELLEAALRRAPGRVELRERLALLRAQIVRVEEGFQEPLQAVIARSRETPPDQAGGARVLSALLAVRVYPDGTARRFRQRIVRIEGPGGVRRFRVAAEAYAPGEQEARFVSAVVVKPSGRRVAVRLPRPAGGGGGGGRLVCRLPPLEPGDIVATKTRVTDLAPGFFGEYFGLRHIFQQDVPVEVSRLVLIAPKTRPIYDHRRQVEAPRFEALPGGLTARIFEVRKLPAHEAEPQSPSPAETAPTVYASTFRDWPAFSRWYWNLVKRQLEQSPALAEKAEELCLAARTPREKVAAIYGFVAQQVRYNDRWEFGVHGYKPYNAGTIFDRRFGDCKDKAILICTMLEVVGVRAVPALLGADPRRSEEDLALPLIRHFNHCIAYVPKQPGIEAGWFLDGTAQFHDARSLPAMDAGARALVVDREAGVLARMPTPRALRENALRETAKVELRSDGPAEVELTLRPVGPPAAVLRELLQNPARQREVLERVYGRVYPGTQARSVETSDLQDLGRPVEVRARLLVPGLLERGPDGAERLRELQSVLYTLLYTQALRETAGAETRQHDLLLPVPSGVETDVTYELPPGRVALPGGAPGVVESPFGRRERTVEATGDALRVRTMWRVDIRRVPAKAYPRWRKFVEAWALAERRRVPLEQAEAPR